MKTISKEQLHLILRLFWPSPSRHEREFVSRFSLQINDSVIEEAETVGWIGRRCSFCHKKIRRAEICWNKDVNKKIRATHLLCKAPNSKIISIYDRQDVMDSEMKKGLRGRKIV